MKTIPLRLLSLMPFAALAACGGGGGSTTAPLPVRPSPTTAPFTEVNVVFATAPQAVAVQVGSGNWQSVSASGTSLTIKLPVPASAFGLAYVCPPVSSANSDDNQEFIVEASTKDGTSYSAPCPAPTAVPAPASITGSFDVSALPGAGGVKVSIGPYAAFGSLNSGGTGTYSGAYASGTADVVALAEAGRTIVGAKILRNQSITNNAVVNIPPFASSDATTTQTIALPDLMQSFIPYESVAYVTPGGTSAVVSDPSLMNSYAVIPQTEAAAGDYYDSVYSQSRVTTAGLESVTAEETFTASKPLSIVLPRSPHFYTIGSTPFPTFTFDNASLSLSGTIYDIGSIDWGTNPSAYAITMIATQNWLGTNTMLTVPNLTGLAGFFPPASSGTPVRWSASSNIVTVPPASFDPATLPLNAARQSVGVRGNFTEP